MQFTGDNSQPRDSTMPEAYTSSIGADPSVTDPTIAAATRTDSMTGAMRTLSLSDSPQSLPTRAQMGKRWSLASSSSGYDSSSALWLTSSEDADLLTVGRAYSDHDMSDQSSRSRSTSPYSPTPRGYNMDMVTLQNLFRDRYPKAIEQMQYRLKTYLKELSLQEDVLHKDAAVHFVATQLTSLAKDFLEKSETEVITVPVFQSISDDLTQLNDDNIRRGATEETLSVIQKMLHQMAVIIARPAGLLECMEHDVETLASRRHLRSPGAGTTLHVLGDPESLPSAGQLGNSSHLLQYVRQCLTPRDLSPRDRRLSEVKSEEEEEEGEEEEEEEDDEEEAVTEVASQDVQPKADDFEHIKIISSGAYGSVYLVRHKERQQVFAMKKVAKSNVIRKKNLDQVFAERNILTFANNPFVVGLWCTFETKKHFCMVLEYVEGGDCAALLKNIGGPLPTDLARLYVAETVLALEYLHNYGIVHRDLKPDNMLITSIGHIKLTDFGLSKVGLMSYATTMYEEGLSHNQVFNDEQVFGTPDYIAPEVILRQGYGPPVDWWALGIVLYQFLRGYTPFIGDTVEELFEQITDESVLPEFPQNEPFSEDGRKIIEDLLVRDPGKRLGSNRCSGVADVKYHAFFSNVDWRNLLLQKAEFIPQLDNEEDTSYFDPRTDRYDHTLGDDDDDAEGDEDCLYSNFMSMSPSFSRILTPPLSRQTSMNRSDSDLSDVSSQDTSSVLSSPLNAWRPTDLDTSSQHSSVTSGSTETSSLPSTPEMSFLERPRTLCSRRASAGTPPTPDAIVVVPPVVTVTTAAMAAARTNATASLAMPSTTAALGGGALGMMPMSLGSLAAFNRHAGLDRPIRLARRRQSLDETSVRLRSRLASLGPRLSDNSSAAYNSAATSTSSLATSGTTVASLAPLSSAMASYRPSASSQNSLGGGITVTLLGRGSLGMALRAIRVFLGNSDNYVVQHLIKDVAEGSLSWQAGVRPDHLITHIDGLPVVGLKHTDVVQLLNNSRKTSTTMQIMALSSTTISHKCNRRQSSNAKRLSSKHEHKLTRSPSNSSMLKKKLSMLPRLSRRPQQQQQQQQQQQHRSSSSRDHTDAVPSLAPGGSSGGSPTVACAKVGLSLHQRIARAMQPRRPSLSSLTTPMSPLATVSQTSPQRQQASCAGGGGGGAGSGGGKSHSTLRRTASVGSHVPMHAPPPLYRRSSRTPPRHEQHSVTLRQHHQHRHDNGGGTTTSFDVLAASSGVRLPEPQSPRRHRLRRTEVRPLSDVDRKSSE